MSDLQIRVLALSLLGALFVAGPAVAQLNFSVSPTPVGSGARAAGMSDAFVAVADDATAASWNPAGLVQLEEPEFSFVHAYNRLGEDISAMEDPNFDTGFNNSFSGDDNSVNFASFVYPTYVLGRNMSFSISYQNRYDFGRSLNTNFNSFNPDFGGSGNSVTNIARFGFEQSGALGTITPAFAISLTNTLSVGVSMNFWRDNIFSQNDWTINQTLDRSTFQNGTLQGTLSADQVENFRDFSGENYIIGVLWNATDKWNIGLRYDTSFIGEVNYFRQTNVLQNGVSQTTIESDKRTLKFPWTFAIGTSYRFTDRFTLSMDMSVSDWNESYLEDGAGQRFQLIDGIQEGAQGSTHIERNVVVRLGAEYVFIPKNLNENLDYLWSLRGGLVYEEEPATGKATGGPNAALPGDGKPESFYGASIGVGLLVKQRFNFDFAYQFRYGDGVNSDFITGPEGFSEDTKQHRLILSTVIYF